MEVNNTCQYRNCEGDLSHRRKGAKFCCGNCKAAEKVYRRRDKAKIEKYKAIEMERVELIKAMKQMIKDLI